MSLEAAYSDLRLFRRSGLDRPDVAVCASNRAGQIYRLPLCAEGVRELAQRLDHRPEVDVALFLEDGDGGGEEGRRGAAVPAGRRRRGS